VDRPPPRPKRISFFFLKKKKWVWPLGWPIHSQGPLGPPQTGHWGWQKPPHGPWGWIGHPQGPNPFFFKKKKFILFGPWGWPIHPPRAKGWLRPPQTGGLGWPKPPLCYTRVAGHPLWAGRPPIIFFKFFFFFFNFSLFLFLFKFILKNNKIMTSGLATSALMGKIWRFACKEAFL
jgi:hypothetical protein